ncbi:MAG: transposase, partial [Terriglobia bacterium]
KDGATRRINHSRRETGRLWQPRFFDRALRTVEEYNAKVEYIHWNPVKAGLVSRPEEWAWSSVHDYTGSVQRPVVTPSGLAVDRVLLPPMNGLGYNGMAKKCRRGTQKARTSALPVSPAMARRRRRPAVGTARR